MPSTATVARYFFERSDTLTMLSDGDCISLPRLLSVTGGLYLKDIRERLRFSTTFDIVVFCMFPFF